MNLKRTLMLCAACGLLAALLSSAATSFTGTRRVAPLPAPRNSVDVSGASLAAEIAKLHDRLHPTVVPQQPARNLFAFNAARAIGPVAAPQTVEPARAVPQRPVAPALKLSGIAEDPGADGPVRTAIVSGSGDLFFAKEGEAVTARYRITHIAEDSVDLTDVTDGTTLHLDLK